MKNGKIIITIIAIIIVLAILLILKILFNDSSKTSENLVPTAKKESNTINIIDNEINNNKEENNMYTTGKHHAKIEINNYGTIELELNADVAPITVANFAKLTNEGFYDGLTFHRIIDGFMIQGGDPEGTGMGGSKDNIKGEFSANGVKNDISHVRGVISMARANAYNSASSQFFIVHEDSEFLDGQYAGFGIVTSGIEIVDKICKNTPVEDNNGTVLPKNQPVIEKIIMID